MERSGGWLSEKDSKDSDRRHVPIGTALSNKLSYGRASPIR